MSGMPEEVVINMSTEERDEFEGLVRSTRRSTGCDSAPASFCLRPTAWRAGRSDGGSAARPARHSKWRGRYSDRPLAGLHETGNPGARPKKTAPTGKPLPGLLD